MRRSTLTSLADLTKLALAFRDERNWKQFHNPKDVALSMSLEVAELVEIMQWKNGRALNRHLAAEREHVGQELSDILYWVLVLAHDLNIDLPAAFRAKLRHNAQKYPIEKAKGVARKYRDL
jgi:dCTP diphosphatase